LPIKTMVDAELHVGGSTSFTLVFLLRASSPFPMDEDGYAHARNIFPTGYEFESDRTAIS
jgi:hypothetical protein